MQLFMFSGPRQVKPHSKFCTGMSLENCNLSRWSDPEEDHLSLHSRDWAQNKELQTHLCRIEIYTIHSTLDSFAHKYVWMFLRVWNLKSISIYFWVGDRKTCMSNDFQAGSWQNSIHHKLPCEVFFFMGLRGPSVLAAWNFLRKVPVRLRSGDRWVRASNMDPVP